MINLAPQPFNSQRPVEERSLRQIAGSTAHNSLHQPLSSRSQHVPLEVGAIPRQRRTDAAPPNRSFFQGAQNIQTGDLQFIDANHVIIHPQTESVDGWELLLKNTAPNALHNSRARYDAPKCDEDTRVEVTGEIMTFIENWDGPQRLLCMTGAAGSGKSALQQTTAERCGTKNTLGASFFFSATDPSRNIMDPVVPTIAYQLGRRSPEVKRLINAAVEEDPLIFSQSLQDQMATLVVGPFERLGSEGLDLSTLPYVILIDGLDECSGEDSQAELLMAIRECLLADHLPFRIFIASRPEWAIRTALAPGGYLHALAYHIQLSDKYDASGDMRRYLQRRFHALSSRTGNPHWFTQNDIDRLVSAASGQFVYVAMAFNYISERRASPAERLKIVLNWTPHDRQKARPFEALDILYRNILSTAKNAYEAVDSNGDRDFLLLFRIHHLNISMKSWSWRFSANGLSMVLGLETGGEEELFSDLRSLLTLEKNDSGDLTLRLYHKSFSDFLDEESRAKALFVPRSHLYPHLESREDAEFHLLRVLADSARHLPDIVLEAHSSQAVGGIGIGHELAEFTQKGGWHKLDKSMSALYPSEDAAVILKFCDKWWSVWEEHELRRIEFLLKR
ncbi:hypothetical protein EST38_g4636 [Candolleomyces aberdarensis]|uniref:Nephrocystin 3-like N-terminal domain-containing protein n=1 Tax=Candolleomyces aberdarensis TaxID=2316362 RepID=A0A4Q2DQG9_9AGAR|nr:hypothetical protein EST38_g4636 [Candolleomyces aberdarensis]